VEMENQSLPAGSLKISQDVIASIARYATLEVEGVESVSTGNIGVKGLITKTTYTRAVRIELSDDVVNVEISIIVKHGVKISQIALAVQNNVKNSIQNMTGLAVARVDVVIAGVSIAPEKSDK